MSVNNTSPASLFGGTWEKIQDRFLLASGSSYSLGATGGEKEHNHTLSSNGFAKIGYTWTSSLKDTLFMAMSSHSFISTLRTGGDTGYDEAEQDFGWAVDLGGKTDTRQTMPPYLVVNVWKRIS